MRHTKRVLADAVHKLLAHKNMAQIRVGDICREAGVSRAAFYYNFRDKNDLITWIFLDMAVCFEVSSMRSAGVAMMQKMQRHRTFFRGAMEDQSQNSLYYFFRQYYMDRHTELLRLATGSGTLPTALLASIRIYCHGCADVTQEWLQSRSDDAAAGQLAASMFDAMPGLMRNAYGF